MPIYEFECSACGHVFDRLQRLSDPDPAACPECANAGVRRRVTAPSFRLAGSGWYETDFKGEKDVKRNLAGKDEGARPEARPDTKSDTKPDSKPDTRPDTKPESKSEPKASATA